MANQWKYPGKTAGQPNIKHTRITLWTLVTDDSNTEHVFGLSVDDTAVFRKEVTLAGMTAKDISTDDIYDVLSQYAKSTDWITVAVFRNAHRKTLHDALVDLGLREPRKP